MIQSGTSMPPTANRTVSTVGPPTETLFQRCS
jgi:hypothetical protein